MVAVRSNRLVGADTQRITSDVEHPFSAPATIGQGHRTAVARHQKYRTVSRPDR